MVKTFTTRVSVNYSSTMGYGFDTSCPGNIMKNCFGHHGSTGCSAWTDRATNISFGLVTNRGHPNVDNGLFWDYIPKIANEIMKALGYSEWYLKKILLNYTLSFIMKFSIEIFLLKY